MRVLLESLVFLTISSGFLLLAEKSLVAEPIAKSAIKKVKQRVDILLPWDEIKLTPAACQTDPIYLHNPPSNMKEIKVIFMPRRFLLMFGRNLRSVGYANKLWRIQTCGTGHKVTHHYV